MMLRFCGKLVVMIGLAFALTNPSFGYQCFSDNRERDHYFSKNGLKTNTPAARRIVSGFLNDKNEENCGLWKTAVTALNEEDASSISRYTTNEMYLIRLAALFNPRIALKDIDRLRSDKDSEISEFATKFYKEKHAELIVYERTTGISAKEANVATSGGKIFKVGSCLFREAEFFKDGKYFIEGNRFKDWLRIAKVNKDCKGKMAEGRIYLYTDDDTREARIIGDMSDGWFNGKILPVYGVGEGSGYSDGAYGEGDAHYEYHGRNYRSEYNYKQAVGADRSAAQYLSLDKSNKEALALFIKENHEFQEAQEALNILYLIIKDKGQSSDYDWFIRELSKPLAGANVGSKEIGESIKTIIKMRGSGVIDESDQSFENRLFAYLPVDMFVDISIKNLSAGGVIASNNNSNGNWRILLNTSSASAKFKYSVEVRLKKHLPFNLKGKYRITGNAALFLRYRDGLNIPYDVNNTRRLLIDMLPKSYFGSSDVDFGDLLVANSTDLAFFKSTLELKDATITLKDIALEAL